MSDNDTTPPGPSRDLRLLDVERTPVGTQNNSETKIQLCIEIREREKRKRRASGVGVKNFSSSAKPGKELVLEVTVMYLKNLFKTTATPVSTPTKKRKPQDIKRPTFVKIQLIPGSEIYSTELKMDKVNREKVDLNFIEVFAFPLESLESLKDKKLEVLVCDKKMTRNATTFGQVTIGLEEYKLGKPVCKWFSVDNSHQNQNSDLTLAKP